MARGGHGGGGGGGATTGPDTLTGAAKNDTIIGLTGSDHITGGGSDILIGDDDIKVSTGSNSVPAGTIDNLTDSDTLIGDGGSTKGKTTWITTY